MYNLIITKPITNEVNRVIRYFNKGLLRTVILIVHYTKDGYDVTVKKYVPFR